MEKLCYDFYKGMNEAIEKKETETVMSELDLPKWSVVSFDKCEASGLTYVAAVQELARNEAEGVYGLCIVTDAAASRIQQLGTRRHVGTSR